MVRAFAVRDLIDDQERAHLRQDVRVMALRIDDRIAAGDPIDQAFLDDLVTSDVQATFERNGETVVATGAGYHVSDGEDALVASAEHRRGAAHPAPVLRRHRVTPSAAASARWSC